MSKVVEATATVDTSTIHGLLVHTSNLQWRLMLITRHAKAQASENARLRAEIRASSSLAGTAMAELCPASSSAPLRTATGALHESLVREEEVGLRSRRERG